MYDVASLDGCLLSQGVGNLLKRLLQSYTEGLLSVSTPESDSQQNVKGEPVWERKDYLITLNSKD